MNQFLIYFKQGISHITDLNGLDHMVFIVTLYAIFSIKEWRQLLVLITAFTIGHSITLALASLKVIPVNQQLVETLIPITIFITSMYNVTRKESSIKRFRLNYFMALIFGLIHGMGFSNFFSAMMMGISDESIVLPLFAFNVGIELGQLCIVAGFVALHVIINTVFKVSQRAWNIYVSGAGGGIAITMIIKAFL